MLMSVGRPACLRMMGQVLFRQYGTHLHLCRILNTLQLNITVPFFLYRCFSHAHSIPMLCHVLVFYYVICIRSLVNLSQS
jgi:hypothetical protein